MKRFYLFLLAVALIISTPLLTSCSDSDSENTPAETTLNFVIWPSHSETAPELYDDNEVRDEIWSLARQTLTQTLGGNTMVVVPETEVGTVLDNVKQAFDKLVAETNAKRAYPGLYTFTVKCNEKEVTQATFYTPDIWAAVKVNNVITYNIKDEQGEMNTFIWGAEKTTPAAAYMLTSTLKIKLPKGYNLPFAGDETLVQKILNVYGDLVVTNTYDLTKYLERANKYSNIAQSFSLPTMLHGGEYSASVHCDYLEYTEDINLFITEDPGVKINQEADDENNTVFQLTLTTGYPYNVDDYMNDIVLNATVLKDVDGEEEVVAEVPLTVKLVNNPSHNRVAAIKTYDIYKLDKPSVVKYKIRVSSDWKPGNKEAEFFFTPAEEQSGS